MLGCLCTAALAAYDIGYVTQGLLTVETRLLNKDRQPGLL